MIHSQPVFLHWSDVDTETVLFTRWKWKCRFNKNVIPVKASFWSNHIFAALTAEICTSLSLGFCVVSVGLSVKRKQYWKEKWKMVFHPLGGFKTSFNSISFKFTSLFSLGFYDDSRFYLHHFDCVPCYLWSPDYNELSKPLLSYWF